MGLWNRSEGIMLTCEEAIENYSDTVYKVALCTMKNEADAQDVFQEVFLRYVKNKKSFDSHEHLKAWFIRVTLNCCNTMFTSKTRRESVPLEMDFAKEEAPDLGVIYVVNELEEKYRTVIHLFYYEQMSIVEIAHLLNEKEGAIKTRLSRARAMLKEKWEVMLHD